MLFYSICNFHLFLTWSNHIVIISSSFLLPFGEVKRGFFLFVAQGNDGFDASCPPCGNIAGDRSGHDQQYGS